jgi:hypothetical protein
MTLTTEKTLQMLEAIASNLQTSISRFMPESAYRDYCLWALSESSPGRQDWLQLNGAIKLAYLMTGLFNGIASDDQWEYLAACLAPLNTYFVFEAISDDLALGLGVRPTPSLYNPRRTLLAFNQAMITRLTSTDCSSQALLYNIRPTADLISSFAHKLVPARHHTHAEFYQSYNPDVSLESLDYSAWPALVANMETCAILVEQVVTTKPGHFSFGAYSAVMKVSMRS